MHVLFAMAAAVMVYWFVVVLLLGVMKQYLLLSTLRGDKVSMLTHTYSHKPPRKIRVARCSHQADNPLYVWPDVWSGDLQI